MSVLAFAVYVIGLVVCFGVRSWTHSRRSGGDTGFRRPRRDPGSVAWWSAVLFVAALLLGLAGPLLDALGLIDPLMRSDGLLAIQWAGLLLAVAGFVGTVAAQGAMGTSWRIGVETTERTELVESGAFAWSRNPIFLAMAVTLVGLTVVVPNGIQLAALVCLLAAIELQVRWVEEPYLLRTHGADYAEYASQVGRFLPGIGRLGRRTEARTPDS